MDVKFEAAVVTQVADDYVESFAAKAKEELAANTGVAADKVEATIVPSVTASMTFKEYVTAEQARKIVVAATGLSEDKVTVTAKTGRRLGGKARRLASEFDVKMEVADTAQAKKVAADVQDTEKLVKKAEEQGVTITAPTVSQPALVIDVQYVVDDEVSAPTAEQLTNLGSALGAKVQVSNVKIEAQTTTQAPSLSEQASSARRP